MFIHEVLQQKLPTTSGFLFSKGRRHHLHKECEKSTAATDLWGSQPRILEPKIDLTKQLDTGLGD